MITILITLIFLIIAFITLAEIENKENRKIISFIIIFLLSSYSIYFIDIEDKIQETGKKKAYINMLKGGENPYKRVIEKDTVEIEKDTLYVKKNKKNKN